MQKLFKEIMQFVHNNGISWVNKISTENEGVRKDDLTITIADCLSRIPCISQHEHCTKVEGKENTYLEFWMPKKTNAGEILKS